MSNPTSNFGWQMPTPTDLVTDLPADFEVFGQAVDSTMADLKGGTTGQILSKNSNTDMDFVWTSANPGDITGVTAGTGISGGGTSGDVTITNSMATEITAKGDLIVGTGSATFDNLAAGSNGQTLVADSSTSTGLSYQANWAAGKNKIINGAFNVWQRGTSFTSPTSNTTYTADRWLTGYSVAPTTYSVSQQAFTAGTAPVAGYEGTYFYRGTITTAGSNTAWEHKQRIEDVRTFAGQTVTLSFWAKADSSRTGRVFFLQNFGSGGSGSVYSTAYNISLTTSWTRFTQTVSIASVSGKTIGTGSYLEATIEQPSANGSVIDIWGVQVEAGSVATAFQTATGTIQGELAACQRYFWRAVNGTGAYVVTGQNYATTNGLGIIQFPVTMRTGASVTVSNATHFSQTDSTAGNRQLSAFSADSFTNTSARLTTTCGAFMTAGNATLINSTNASATLDFGAEL